MFGSEALGGGLQSEGYSCKETCYCNAYRKSSIYVVITTEGAEILHACQPAASAEGRIVVKGYLVLNRIKYCEPTEIKTTTPKPRKSCTLYMSCYILNVRFGCRKWVCGREKGKIENKTHYKVYRKQQLRRRSGSKNIKYVK